MSICPRVTVVTVTYNCELLIEETIKSVINQDYEDLEYIIVDGVSSDKTLDVINRYSANIDLIISERDTGIFDAMNKGIFQSTGDWIIFINAGDYLSENTTISDIFKNTFFEEKTGIIYGDYLYREKDSDQWVYMIARPFFEKKAKYKKMGICHQSIFVRASLAKANPFDTSFKVAADYNMIYSLFFQGFSCMRIRAAISKCSEFGFSRRFKILQIKEISKICKTPFYIEFLQYGVEIVKNIKSRIKSLLTMK